MTVLANSTFLDFTSYGTTTATTVNDAYGLKGDFHAEHGSAEVINVAFVVDRATDASSLLASDWGTRQTTLAELGANLWTTYGASPSDYASTLHYLNTLGPGGTSVVIGDAAGAAGYVTSPDSRTIWATLTADQFHTIFGQTLYVATDTGMQFWQGSLSVPDDVKIKGLWFDTEPVFGTPPAVSNLAGDAHATVAQGPQSIGNALSVDHSQTNVSSGDMAQWFYDFPLSGAQVPTATIGLIEPSIGTALEGIAPDRQHQVFQERLDAYRQSLGLPASPPGSFYVVNNGGDSYSKQHAGERSLDVGVVTAINPAGTIGLYAGSGPSGNPVAHGNGFTAYQAAFWDDVHHPAVISSSFSIEQQTAPGSPFAYAAQQLFVDAALRNITMVQANNDFGSSWDFANGLANQAINSSSPYAILVGGTSLTTLAAASQDATVTALYDKAMAGDMAVLWHLVEGGLVKLPSAVADTAAGSTTLLEAVWNSYYLSGTHETQKLGASDGGIDTSQATPSYQTAFGLVPTSDNPDHATGRGAPDVSANAGGNMFYNTLDPNMTTVQADDGTSAATPLWATLVSQIDTIFHDQGLPNLGYMNDLLYIAAAVAPASFNDITMGNNVTSFREDGPNTDFSGDHITYTGYGYYAGPGYDLTTGLGSPNGTLLARALTTIAHSEISFHSSPHMLDSDADGHWSSGTDQTVLFQAMSGNDANIALFAGSSFVDYTSDASDSYAWTSRFAQQSLQPDFDSHLVRLYDRQAQGLVTQSHLSSGDDLLVAIDATVARPVQGTLTSPFGFADFISGDGAVRVARPVAVAETADGHDDQTAIVRLRQDGEDKLAITFYRVDDLSGAINGLHPGDAGYQAALQSHAYTTSSGGTSIDGPGYGNFAQAALLHVNAGDLVAMQLDNKTSGTSYSGFAQANETVDGQHVGHLWNYGVNTWGWEDTKGGGDHDYNDLVIGLDFTSASGHGWLV
jgi:hypothetical protein